MILFAFLSPLSCLYDSLSIIFLNVVVINFIKVLMMHHFLQVLLHFLLADVLVGVCLFVPCNHLWVF